MKKIIAVLNYKGGVGKTTTAINLGAALHARGGRVLVCDLDGQCNTTRILGYDADDGETLYDAMTSRRLSLPLPVYGYADGYDFVPASPQFETIERDLSERYHKEDILRALLAPVTGNYDYILLDCPPNKGVMSSNALCAATDLLVPMGGDPMSLQGVGAIMEKFGDVVAEANPSLRLMGFLLTMFNERTNINRDVARLMADRSDGRLLHTRIRRCIALSEAPAQRQTIFDYAPQSNGAKDYAALAAEIENDNDNDNDN